MKFQGHDSCYWNYISLWNLTSISVHENRRTCRTFPMARAKCPMRDLINFNRIYKAHRTIVWWTMTVFRLHWSILVNMPVEFQSDWTIVNTSHGISFLQGSATITKAQQNIVSFISMINEDLFSLIHGQLGCEVSTVWLGFKKVSRSIASTSVTTHKLRLIDYDTSRNSDLSNMAELPSFSPPASESTLQYRTSPPRQARMRPKLKAAPMYI